MGADPIVVLIVFKLQPGKESLALQVMTSLIAKVRREEPSCSGITMIQDAADPTRVMLDELGPDRESYLGAHMQTPHIKAFQGQGGDLFAGPPDITFWNPVARV